MNPAMAVAAGSLLVLSACVAQGSVGDGGTPFPSSGPAFAPVAELRSRRCDDVVCVRARVRNYGERAGTGSCQLLGTDQDPDTGDSSINGPTIMLPTVQPGGTTAISARWSGPIPDGGLRFLCSPGLLL